MAELNPGSPEAIEKGCTCPILDNNKGAGTFWSDKVEPFFWYNLDCPIHGGKNESP